MTPEFDALLTDWLVRCLHLADRVPSPAEPVDDATEQEADRFLFRVIAQQEWENPSPEVASALIFRLRFAKFFGSIYESGMHDPVKPKGDREEQRALLEALLVTAWHQTGKPAWLTGKWK